MTPQDPPLRPEAPFDPAERSLVDDLRELASDGRTLLEAEIAYQKSRAMLAGSTAKSIAGWLALALALVFFSLMALTVGAVLALVPLLGALGATVVVVLVLLAAAALSARVAIRRWRVMTERISESTDA